MAGGNSSSGSGGGSSRVSSREQEQQRPRLVGIVCICPDAPEQCRQVAHLRLLGPDRQPPPSRSIATAAPQIGGDFNIYQDFEWPRIPVSAE